MKRYKVLWVLTIDSSSWHRTCAPTLLQAHLELCAFLATTMTGNLRMACSWVLFCWCFNVQSCDCWRWVCVLACNLFLLLCFIPSCVFWASCKPSTRKTCLNWNVSIYNEFFEVTKTWRDVLILFASFFAIVLLCSIVNILVVVRIVFSVLLWTDQDVWPSRFCT